MQRVQLGAALISAASLLGLILLPLPLYGRALAAVFLLLGAYGWLRLERTRLKAESDARLVATLAHHRHDWMNDVQVLFGFVRLGKYDKLQPYLDKLKISLHQESYIAKLGIAPLVAYLVSFRTARHPLVLDVLAEEELNLERIPVLPETVTLLMTGVIDSFCEAAIASEGEPYVLSIEIEGEDAHLLIDYVYDGEYNRDILEDSLDKLLRKAPLRKVECEREWEEERAAVAVRLPYLSMKDTAG